jgi:hypothetical protein
MLRYIELKNMRSQFLETTSVPVEEFEKYLPSFAAAYQELYPSEKTNADQSHPPEIGSPSNTCVHQSIYMPSFHRDEIIAL